MPIAYAAEVAAALLTSACVSPMVALVDKAIFMRASGQMDSYQASFHNCFRMFLEKPYSFFARKTFWWSYAVYSCTFVASNLSERAAQSMALQERAATRVQLLAVCAVNIPLSAMRDRHLARSFSLAPERAVGRVATAAFVVRDLVNMVGAFSAIGPVAHLFESFGLPELPARLLSQMICPFVALLINTPIFMYGLHKHNYPNAGSIKMIVYIWNNFWETFYWARMARVGTAYSVGGVLNMGFRAWLTRPVSPPPPPPPPPPPAPTPTTLHKTHSRFIYEILKTNLY